MAKKTYSKDPQGPPPGVIPLLSSARAALQQTFSSLKAQRSKPPKKKSKASEGLKLSKEDWSTNATAQHEKTRKALLLTRTLYEGLFPTAVKLLEENPGSGLTPRQLVDRVVHSPQLKKTRGYNAHNAFGRLIGLLRRNQLDPDDRERLHDVLELYDSIRMPELQRGDIGTPLGADPEETQNEMSLQREHGSVQHHTSSEASGGATEEPIDQQRNQPGPTTAERACRTVKEKDDDKVYREVLGRQTEDEYNLFAARLADESYDSTRAVFKRWFEEDTAARRLGAAPTERGISKDFENNADKIAATLAQLAVRDSCSYILFLAQSHKGRRYGTRVFYDGHGADFMYRALGMDEETAAQSFMNWVLYLAQEDNPRTKAYARRVKAGKREIRDFLTAGLREITDDENATMHYGKGREWNEAYYSTTLGVYHTRLCGWPVDVGKDIDSLGVPDITLITQLWVTGSLRFEKVSRRKALKIAMKMKKHFQAKRVLRKRPSKIAKAAAKKHLTTVPDDLDDFWHAGDNDGSQDGKNSGSSDSEDSDDIETDADPAEEGDDVDDVRRRLFPPNHRNEESPEEDDSDAATTGYEVDYDALAARLGRKRPLSEDDSDAPRTEVAAAKKPRTRSGKAASAALADAEPVDSQASVTANRSFHPIPQVPLRNTGASEGFWQLTPTSIPIDPVLLAESHPAWPFSTAHGHQLMPLLEQQRHVSMLLPGLQRHPMPPHMVPLIYSTLNGGPLLMPLPAGTPLYTSYPLPPHTMLPTTAPLHLLPHQTVPLQTLQSGLQTPTPSQPSQPTSSYTSPSQRGVQTPNTPTRKAISPTKTRPTSRRTAQPYKSRAMLTDTDSDGT